MLLKRTEFVSTPTSYHERASWHTSLETRLHPFASSLGLDTKRFVHPRLKTGRHMSIIFMVRSLCTFWPHLTKNAKAGSFLQRPCDQELGEKGCFSVLFVSTTQEIGRARKDIRVGVLVSVLVVAFFLSVCVCCKLAFFLFVVVFPYVLHGIVLSSSSSPY